MIITLILFSMSQSLWGLTNIISSNGSILAILIVALIAIVSLVILRFLIPVIIVGIIIAVLLIIIFGIIPLPVQLVDSLQFFHL